MVLFKCHGFPSAKASNIMCYMWQFTMSEETKWRCYFMLYKLLHKNNINSSRVLNKQKMPIKNEQGQDGATPLYIDSVTKEIIKDCPTNCPTKAVIKGCLRLLPSINQTSPKTPSHFVAVSTEVSNSKIVSPAPEAPVSSVIVCKMIT